MICSRRSIETDQTAHISLQLPAISKSGETKSAECALSSSARPASFVSVFVPVWRRRRSVRGIYGERLASARGFFREDDIFLELPDSSAKSWGWPGSGHNRAPPDVAETGPRTPDSGPPKALSTALSPDSGGVLSPESAPQARAVRGFTRIRAARSARIAPRYSIGSICHPFTSITKCTAPRIVAG